MYLFRIDGRTYEPKGGGSFTLPAALAEVYGTAHAQIVRLDGTVAVAMAGSAYSVTHAPTGRRIVRRMTHRARRAWLAASDARNAQLRAEREQRSRAARLRAA